MKKKTAQRTENPLSLKDCIEEGPYVQQENRRYPMKYLLFGGGLLWSLLGASGDAIAAIILNEPLDQRGTVESLVDGNYRFCSEQPFAAASRPIAESNSREGEPIGACFRFRKRGDQIVGDYYYPAIGSSVCLSGAVSGNTITGEAFERLTGQSAIDQNNAALSEANESEPLSTALAPWRRAGFLQVSSASVDSSRVRSGVVRYQQAALELGDFYRYNAGSIVPPVNCSTQSSYQLSVTSSEDSRVVAGTSSYFNQPVYLDIDTIEAVSEGPDRDNVYTYTTFVGLSALLSETDYQVNCNTGKVQVRQSRSYDRDGDLNSVERPVVSTLPTDANSSRIRPDEASQYVCTEYAQIELASGEVAIPAPAEVTYKRYRSDRFDYALLYPADVLNLQMNTGGQVEVFRNEAQSILLRVYGIPVSAPDSLARRYEQAQSGRTATYQTIEEDDFFVVSGTDDGSIFYQKTYLENGVFKVLELQYDESLRQEFGPIARVIGDSFAPVRDRLRISQIPPQVQIAVIEKSAQNIEAESAIFEIVSAKQQTWSDGCLGMPAPDEICTQALVPGWQIRLEAEVAGGIRTFTYRTDETGDAIRFEP